MKVKLLLILMIKVQYEYPVMTEHGGFQDSMFSVHQ